jgi:carboxymethylenebutenolidase
MRFRTGFELRGFWSHVAVVAIGMPVGAAIACSTSSGAGRADTAAARPMDAVTTHGEWIQVRRGADSIRAYVAYPERKTKAPAVIIIHEIFGLTDWEPTVADRLAKGGYVAIVPDLLSSRFGPSPASADSGRKLIALLQPAGITADLDAVYAWVNALPAVERDHIGTIGFCWGGGESFRYATSNPHLKAAVVCYGPPPDSAALARIQAPLLGVYGESDARIDATLPAVSATLKSLGKSYEYNIYPGTGHGFLKPGRQGSDGPEVEHAWSRIMAFYGRALGR